MPISISYALVPNGKCRSCVKYDFASQKKKKKEASESDTDYQFTDVLCLHRDSLLALLFLVVSVDAETTNCRWEQAIVPHLPSPTVSGLWKAFGKWEIFSLRA